MSNVVMELANGNVVHKAAIAGIDARDGNPQRDTDPRVIVYLRTGAAMVSTHPTYAEAIEERDRLKAGWFS